MSADDAVNDRLPFRESARALPARTALFTVCPVVLALVHLAMGLWTELPIHFSAGFAAVMAAFAALMTGYNRTLYRLYLLEDPRRDRQSWVSGGPR